MSLKVFVSVVVLLVAADAARQRQQVETTTTPAPISDEDFPTPASQVDPNALAFDEAEGVALPGDTGRNVIRRFRSPYDTVIVSGNIKAQVKVDREERVEISGPSAEVIAKIITTLVGRVLTVKADKLTTEESKLVKIVVLVNSPANDVTVTAAVNSVVDVDATNELASRYNLKLNLNAGAQLGGKIIVDAVTSTVTGSGWLTLSGKVTNSGIVIRGSARVSAAALESETTNLDIFGSGDLSLFAKTAIAGNVFGSALIRYRSASNPTLAVVTDGFTDFVKN